jgi:hypothetical protein
VITDFSTPVGGELHSVEISTGQRGLLAPVLTAIAGIPLLIYLYIRMPVYV